MEKEGPETYRHIFKLQKEIDVARPIFNSASKLNDELFWKF